MNAATRPVVRGLAALGLTLAVSLSFAGVGGTPSAWADEEEGSAIAGYSDFTDRSTGLYPDVQKNAEYQNSGNRGCVSCHADLYDDVDKSNGTYEHITTYVGLKDGTYASDCKTCHAVGIGTTGNAMSENIHVSHYSNQAFLALNGNCWSCHSMYFNEDGTIVMGMFEDVQYEKTYGGQNFIPGTEANTARFNEMRGWETGTISGVTALNAPDITVDLDQIANEEVNEFLCVNYVRTDGNDAYAAIDPEAWTLEVTGVNNPTTFTLDELKALPTVKTNVAQWCAANGINAAMVDNMPVEGVLLRDLVEACGGLADGANAIFFSAADGWYLSVNGMSAQQLMDSNVLIVFANYDHDLTVYQGGPAKMLIPAWAGALSVKNLTGISFEAVDEPVDMSADFGIYPVNTSWFVNDGVQAKVGETISIEGASMGVSGATMDMHPVQIQFSFDYGDTWLTFDVPEDFDPQQWVHYTLNWTPEQAGTYVLKAKAIGADGTEQAAASNLIVVVSE